MTGINNNNLFLNSNYESEIAILGTPNMTHRFATKSGGKGLNQIPSEVTNYPNDDPNVVEVHVTTANKHSIGNYHVRGEKKNFVILIAH